MAERASAVPDIVPPVASTTMRGSFLFWPSTVGRLIRIESAATANVEQTGSAIHAAISTRSRYGLAQKRVGIVCS